MGTIIAAIFFVIWTISILIVANHFNKNDVSVNPISFSLCVCPIVNFVLAIDILHKKTNFSLEAIKQYFKETYQEIKDSL